MHILILVLASLIALSSSAFASDTFSQGTIKPAPGVARPQHNLAKAPTLERKLDRMEATLADAQEQMDSLSADLKKMSEAQEMDSLRLQMAMDRLSKAQKTISNLQKKISDTNASIANNLR